MRLTTSAASTRFFIALETVPRVAGHMQSLPSLHSRGPDLFDPAHDFVSGVFYLDCL